ncbi:transposase, partial [Azospirillum sp. B4]|uniref:transposase n=1 Tax=Azospirillum sp. B4 TaxID=95605 RepID=UPI0005CB667C
MKRNHSAEEIAQCLAKADNLLEGGAKVVDVARILGISRMTYYRWRRDQPGRRTGTTCAAACRGW